MTDIDLDAGPALDPRAVEAAAEALDGPMPPCTHYEDDTPILCARCDAEVALTAAAPFLRAEGAAAERQRIAAEQARRIADDPASASDSEKLRSIADYLDLVDRRTGHAGTEVQEYLRTLAARIAEADPGTTAPTEGDDRD